MQIHKHKPVIQAEEVTGQVNIPAIGNIVEKIDAETERKTSSAFLKFFHALADLNEMTKRQRDSDMKEELRKTMLEATDGCTC